MSAPRFLPEKQRQERASTPMRRLPRCHLGNPRVECQNTYQVNQYDTPLSPQVFIRQHIYHVFSDLNIQSDKTKLRRVKTQFITTRVERGNIIWSIYVNKAHNIDHEREREREIKHIATGTNPSPEGGLLPPHHGGRWDDEDGHWWWFPPQTGCQNGV